MKGDKVVRFTYFLSIIYDKSSTDKRGDLEYKKCTIG